MSSPANQPRRHSIPDLPEAFIQGRQEEYFDYFYSALSADPSRITAEARRNYAAAYADGEAKLVAFFEHSRGHAGPTPLRAEWQDPASQRQGARGPGSGSSSSAL